MNTRDIRELLRGHIDPRLGKVLIAQQEDIAALKQQLMTLAGLFDQLVNNQISIANATKELQVLRPLIQKQKQMGMEVSSDSSLTGEYDQ